MSTQYLDPARTVIAKISGRDADKSQSAKAAKVAAILGLDRSTVYKWMMPREKKGTGGLVPARYHAELLAYARAHRIKLRESDFFSRRHREDVQSVA